MVGLSLVLSPMEELWGDGRAEFWVNQTWIIAGSLGPPPPPGWSITAWSHRVLQEPWNPGMVWDGRDSLAQVPWKELPQPEDEPRGPAQLFPGSRDVGQPEGFGGPCLLPKPEGRGVWAPGLVPPFHFQIPQIITVFASSCDRND